jgi:hypothetical protein
MSTGRKLVLAAAALAGGIVLAQGVRAQVTGPSRFDPFNPELSLNAPDAGPTTQPTVTSPTTTDPTTPTTPTLSPRPRPIIRDPLRPPTRSPFRP